jgi:hypothetical protein
MTRDPAGEPVAEPREQVRRVRGAVRRGAAGAAVGGVRDRSRSLLTNRPWWCFAGLVFLGAFAFRLFRTDGLSDDHFMHLAWSGQLRAGELPLRDFVDPGMPLTYLVSALAQALFQPTILTEALLCVGALSVAASLSFMVAAHLSQSTVLGLSVAALQVVITPRLYAYPRLLLPVVALGVFWYYASSPSRRRVWLLAGLAVTAFLFRHDYGFIVGTAGACLLCVVHYENWKHLLRQVCSYAGFTLALLTPFWDLCSFTRA